MQKALHTPQSLITRIAGCMTAKSRPSTLRRRKASRGAAPVAGQIDGLEERKLLTTLLTDASGFVWDINDDGGIEGNSNDTGGVDAFDGGHELSVLPDGGTRFINFPDQAPVDDGAQELRFGPVDLGDGLQVTRKVYVSFTESVTDQTQGFARFADIVTNTSDTDATYTLRTSSNLGSDGNTEVQSSSDGDLLVEGTDDFIETRDASGDDPNIGYVRFGSFSSERDTTSSLSLDRDSVIGENTFTVPAGETRILLQFAYQVNASNQNLGERLARLDPTLDPLRGLSNTEVAQVVNFRIDPDLFDNVVPNDSIDTAERLLIQPVVVQRDLTLHRDGGTTNKDVFSIHAGDDGTIQVALEFLHNQGDLNLRILQTNPFGETVIASSASNTDNEFVTFPATRGEVYFVEVDGAPNPNYSLGATNFDVPVDAFDAAARNDTAADATLVTNTTGGLHAGTTSRDDLSLDRESPVNFFDEDFYRFVPAVSGSVTVDASFDGQEREFDTRVSVFDSAGNLVGESNISSFEKTVEFDADAFEEYTVRVDAAVPQPRYSLQVTTPEIQDDFFEPNNRLSESANLGPLGGRFRFQPLSLTDFDQDYFQFTATGTGSASVSIQTDAPADIQLRVFEVRRGSPIVINSNGGTFDVTAGTDYILEFITFEGIVPEYSFDLDTPIPPSGSGNVTAALQRSNLIVRGDDGDNIFDISQSGSTVTVTGLFGTTINGVNSAQFEVDLMDINVRLPDGHNRVHIDGVTTSDDIIVNGGDGIDEVYVVDSNVASDVNVNLLNGADVFVFSDSTTRRIRARTGNGLDQVGFDDAVITGDLNLNTGNGIDSVGLRQTTVGDDVNLVTSSGADRVFAAGFDVADRLSISLGRGDDTLWLRDSSGGRTTLNGGSDDDQNGLHNSTFASIVERGFENTSFGLNAGQLALDALFSDLDDKLSIFG